MADGGSSFLKIMIGVGCGVVLAVVALLGMCTMCVGKVAVDTSQRIEQQKQEKRQLLAALEIRDQEGEIDGEWFKVKGRVCNNGIAPISYVKVQADFLDKAGRVADTDFTYAVASENLAPGACKSFEIMQRAGKARRYRVYVVNE